LAEPPAYADERVSSAALSTSGAEWLKGMPGLDAVLAEADARMRALGVVRKAGA
jgi:hypothetical protein